MTVSYDKVWRTMNDLEITTSKICSAREIIDNAIDAIQEHKSDKAELLMTAAYEFLEYYLQEFDEKFKDAWQATVGDLRDNNVGKEPLTCDKDDPSPECKGAWDSFWEENYYPEEHQQYTEEELNAMCDKAASDEEKEKCREYNLREAEYYNKRAQLDAEIEAIRKAGGYEWTPEVPKKKWVLPVEEAKDVDTDETEYFISLPQDLLETAKLKEGDEIRWVDQGDGTYMICSMTKPLGMDEC